jgi:hypothetical protein
VLKSLFSHGLTKTELANFPDVAQCTVSKILTGACSFAVDHAKRFDLQRTAGEN